MMPRPLLPVCLAIGLSACTSIATNPPDPSPSAATAATEILVTIPQPMAPAAALVGAPGQSYLRRRGYGATPSVDRSLNRLAREYGLRRVRGWLVGSLGVYCEVFAIRPGQDADAIIGRLQTDPRVDLAQRMHTFETLGRQYNDPYAGLQTSIATLDVHAAHELATGRGVTVAIVDSQVDTHHPELRRTVHYSRNLVDRSITNAPEIHGTAIAGVIASDVDNTEGIIGIAPDAELAALRACSARSDDDGVAVCSTFSLALALETALNLGAEIINMSLAGPPDELLGQLLDTALTRGVVVVAAASEDESASAGFPASHPGVIAVRADAAIEAAGTTYLLIAPGREILSTAPGGAYAFFNGNSLAAAHVTGVTALLRETAPGIDPESIVALLRDTAMHGPQGWSINACQALARLRSRQDCQETAVTGPGVR